MEKKLKIESYEKSMTKVHYSELNFTSKSLNDLRWS